MSKLELPKCLKQITDIISPEKLFLVGGYVRDKLANTDTSEKYLDITTSLPSDEIVKILTFNGIRNIVLSEKHKTVLAVFNNFEAEITTFRSTITNCIRADLEEDLKLRDFTINSIAVSLVDGEIIDPLNGQEDLKKGIIKASFLPDRIFKDDPLRIMRLVRFGPGSGRTVDAITAETAIENIKLIHNISKERVRDEFEKILLSKYPDAALKFFEKIGLLMETIPEAVPSVGFEQNEFHTHDVYEHTLEVVRQSPQDRIVRLAAFFHDLGKPATFSVGDDGRRHFYEHEAISEQISKKVMERLKFSNDDIARVAKLVYLHMRPLNCSAPGARRLMRALEADTPLWLDLKRADKPPIFEFEAVDHELENFKALVESEKKRLGTKKPGTLVINGEDLKIIGFKPGPFMGKILKTLEEVVIEDPDKNTKETLLELAKTIK